MMNNTNSGVEPVTPKKQAYFWTLEWQEGEKEADEDIKTGRVNSFDSGEESLRELGGWQLPPHNTGQRQQASSLVWYTSRDWDCGK